MMPGEAGPRLNALLARAGVVPLTEEVAAQFEAYLSLILRWNARLNLTSIRTEESILSNHLAESVVCAIALPKGITSLLDFGSGAGLPGIPVALCRPEVAVTLAESQGKKAAFLQEAVRVLGIPATVHADRAETLRTVFDCVTLRAVDGMPRAVAAAVRLVAPRGWLALMTTDADLADLRAAAGAQFSWVEALVRMPRSETRLLALGQRISSRA